MVLDEIEIADENIAEALIEMERSFGITLPHDLTHVHTAGDLFDEIVKHRAPTNTGDRCDTAMTFFLLRRSLAAQGLEERAHPSIALHDQNLGSPRKVKQRLERETALELPPLVMSARGCALLVVFAAAAISSFAWEFWTLAVLATVGIAVAARVDRGEWSGDWKTLGSLSRATAIRNVMRLEVRGARGRRSDWWRSFVALLLASAGPMHERDFAKADEIGPATRFRFT